MFGLFKKRKQEPSPEFFRQALAAYSFRANMDRVLTTRALSVPDGKDDKLTYEATTVATFVMRNALSRGGYRLESLSDQERSIVGLMTIAAADHLSRLATAQFETVAILTFASVFSPAVGEAEAGRMLQVCGGAFNEIMSRNRPSATVVEFGTLVAKFFESNEDKYLDGLASSLKLSFGLARA